MHTGSKLSAGTDAGVNATLFGAAGDTGAHSLRTSAAQFQRGRTDFFEFTAPNVGAMAKLKFDLFTPSAGDGWYLAKAKVTNLTVGLVGEFLHEGWVEKKTGWSAVLPLTQSWTVEPELPLAVVPPAVPAAPAAAAVQQPAAAAAAAAGVAAATGAAAAAAAPAAPAAPVAEPDWVEMYTDYNGQPVRYFFNKLTGATQYEEPARFIPADKYRAMQEAHAAAKQAEAAALAPAATQPAAGAQAAAQQQPAAQPAAQQKPAQQPATESGPMPAGDPVPVTFRCVNVCTVVSSSCASAAILIW